MTKEHRDTADYRQKRCRHGWVDLSQCEDCKEIAELRERIASLESDLKGAENNRFYDQQAAYWEGLANGRQAD